MVGFHSAAVREGAQLGLPTHSLLPFGSSVCVVTRPVVAESALAFHAVIAGPRGQEGLEVAVADAVVVLVVLVAGTQDSQVLCSFSSEL